MESAGTIISISGPVALVRHLMGGQVGHLVLVGASQLRGEIIAADQSTATIQVFEQAQSLSVGDLVTCTGRRMSIELGPGLLGATFDPLQHPLQTDPDSYANFIDREKPAEASAWFCSYTGGNQGLCREALWQFTPILTVGVVISPGDCYGTVPEGGTEDMKPIDHRLTSEHAGTIEYIAPAGTYRVEDVMLRIRQKDAVYAQKMLFVRPIREHDSHTAKLPLGEHLYTGYRVLDLVFPMLRGATVAIPSRAGVVQRTPSVPPPHAHYYQPSDGHYKDGVHTPGKSTMYAYLSKYSGFDVIVCVGCGYRGGELDKLQHSTFEPRWGGLRTARRVFIACNPTMSAPMHDVAPHHGLAVAQYLRGMGLNVLLMLETTSQWAEAQREITRHVHASHHLDVFGAPPDGHFRTVRCISARSRQSLYLLPALTICPMSSLSSDLSELFDAVAAAYRSTKESHIK